MPVTIGNVQVGERSYPRSTADIPHVVVDAVEYLAQCGFRAIEYNVGGWRAWLRGGKVDLWAIAPDRWLPVAQAAASAGLTASSCHSVDSSRGRPPAESVAEHLRVLDLAAALGSRVVVMHLAAEPTDFTTRQRLDAALQFDLAVLEAVAEAAVARSLRLVVENLPQYSLRYWTLVVERLDHPAVGYVLDTGHLHLRPEADFAKIIRQLGPRLWHVHLHGNHGLRDEHLPVPGGTIRWPEVFAALHEVGYEGLYLQESNVHPSGEPPYDPPTERRLLEESRREIERLTQQAADRAARRQAG